MGVRMTLFLPDLRCHELLAVRGRREALSTLLIALWDGRRAEIP
jgi:hypothetical protein